jgi:hypothetical protein
MTKIDLDVKAQIERGFAPLNNQAAAAAFPRPASLSQRLNSAIPSGTSGITTANISTPVASMFATAAVEVWMRSVHSFLISVSLTEVSPIWASIAGYYSSHYSVRALAHLLGYFQLYTRKRIARLEFQAGRFSCTFNPKHGGDREHTLYWKIVKSHPLFAADTFFTENAGDASDAAHRNHANYADHLASFPQWKPLEAEALRHRIDRLSEVEFKAPPIPKVDRYGGASAGLDPPSAQIIAYHRLVRFRDLVDFTLGDRNRFWNVYRSPAWARDFMDFQLIEEPSLKVEFTS